MEGLNNGRFNDLNGSIGITIKPLEGLSIKANFAPTFSFDDTDNFRTPALIPRLGSTTEFWPRANSFISKSQTNVLNITSQAIITYNKTFGDHNLGVLGGYEEVITDWERISTTSRDLSC